MYSVWSLTNCVMKILPVSYLISYPDVDRISQITFEPLAPMLRLFSVSFLSPCWYRLVSRFWRRWIVVTASIAAGILRISLLNMYGRHCSYIFAKYSASFFLGLLEKECSGCLGDSAITARANTVQTKMHKMFPKSYNQTKRVINLLKTTTNIGGQQTSNTKLTYFFQ